MPGEKVTHFLLTDSGLGGLSICAGLERRFRLAGGGHRARLTYFNAAPDPGHGYNDLPGMDARAAAFDRALAAMDGFRPDRIILACNTLSVLYGRTEHARRSAVPVAGIVEAGVGLFGEALSADPGGVLVILGTRTTIESGAHREALLRKGVPPRRIAAVACHGLAAALERDPEGADAVRLIAEGASVVRALELPGERLYAGLACTHYTFVRDRIREALEDASGKPVRILDPNERLVDEWAPPAVAGRDGTPLDEEGGRPEVKVVSKVPLDETKRRVMVGRIESVSAATARALGSYTYDPELF